MAETSMIKEMYALQKDSCERHARVEAEVKMLSQKFEKQEVLLEKMKETVNRQERIALLVDNISSDLKCISEKLYSQDLKIQKIQEEQTEKMHSQDLKIQKIQEEQTDSDAEIKRIVGQIKDHSEKIHSIQTRSGRNAIAVWKQIGSIGLTVIVTSVLTYLITNFLKK